MRLGFPTCLDYIPVGSGSDWFPQAALLNSYYLTNGLTANSLTMYLYAWYTDVELFTPIIAQGDEDGGDLTLFSSYVKAFASFLGWSIPVITSWSHALRGVASAAMVLGFSRPVQSAQVAMFPTQGSSLAFMGGQPDFSEKLASHPGVSSDLTRKNPLATDGETNISSIVRRWGLLAWGQPCVGSTLINVCASPFAVPTYITAAAPFTAGFQELTPLAWVQFAFDGYQGDLEYRFEFVANSFMRALYAIQVVPVGYTAPTSYVEYSGYATTVVEVVGRTVVDVVVPYSGTVPITFPAPVAWSNVGSSFPQLVVFQVTPVQSQTSTPAVIYVNIYVRAGKKYLPLYPGFASLGGFESQPYVNSYTLGLTSTNSYVPQGDTECCDPALALALTGEAVVDVNYMCRRPCLNALLTFAWTHTLSYGIPVAGMVPSTATSVSGGSTGIPILALSWTLSQWFASGFYASTGGFRHKLFLNGSAASAGIIQATCRVAALTGVNNLAPTFIGSLTGWQETSSGTAALDFRFRPVLEFESPFRNQGHFRYNRLCYPASSYSAQECFIYTNPSNESTQNAVLYVSGSDDFHLSGYLCPPVLAYQP